MKLLLRREQRSGLMGKVVFVLTVRADIPQAEKDAITKYKLGDCLLYQRDSVSAEPSWSGLAKVMVKNMLNVTIKAKELVDGKTIECKDIMEMLAAEVQVKEAGDTFARMLAAAMHFGGEEVVEL